MGEPGGERRGHPIAGGDPGDETPQVVLPQTVITTQAIYDRHTAELLGRARDIEIAKRPDYTVNDVDVLKNFKASGAEAGITPEQAWIIFAKKHWDAIRTIMRNPDGTFSEPPRERFADLINYLKLGYALHRERRP